MSYPLFDKDEHWHKPEQAFLTDDHRTILRFAVEALMSARALWPEFEEYAPHIL